MKYVIIVLIFAQTQLMACMCIQDLTEAFSEIEDKIFTQNVVQMQEKLETTNEKVQNNIDALQERIEIYTKHIAVNSLYLKEVTRSVKDEKTLIKVDK